MYEKCFINKVALTTLLSSAPPNQLRRGARGPTKTYVDFLQHLLDQRVLGVDLQGFLLTRVVTGKKEQLS